MPEPIQSVDVLSEPRIVMDEHGGGSQAFEQATEGLAGAAELLANQRAQNLGKGLAAELDQTTNEWWAENTLASQNPDVADIFQVDPAELANAPAPVQAMMEEVARQRLAAEQGAISGTELKVRHEKVLREYLNRYPQLTQELQAVAGTTLGYSPLGAHIDALMQSLEGQHATSSAEWEAIDKYADAVGVNMTLKTVAPVQYYTQVMEFAQRDTEYEYLQRELNITKLGKEQRNIAENDRFRRVAGANILGRAAGLTAKISRMVTASGTDKGTFANDVLPMIQNEVAQFKLGTRSRLLADFPELTGEQVEQFMGPIDENLNLILQANSVGNLQTALQMFKGQAEAQVYASNPDIVSLQIAADITRGLPETLQNLQTSDLAPSIRSMFSRLVPGTTVVGGDGRDVNPKNMTPNDRSVTYKGLVDGLTNMLPQAKKNPTVYEVEKRGVLQMFDFLAIEQRDLNTSGAKEANEAFVNFWQDPDTANIFKKGNATSQELARVQEGIKFAANALRHKARENVSVFEDIRSDSISVGLGGSLTYTPPEGGPRRVATMGDLLEMEVGASGDVVFKANWSNIGIPEAKVPGSTKTKVNKAVSRLNMTFAQSVEESIKMIAHLQGSTDYQAVAGVYGEELQAPLVSSLLLPGG